MISISRSLGILMMVASTITLIIYTLWVFGFISSLDPNLAVKIGVYAIVLIILVIIGILGYLMATYKQPATVKPVGRVRGVEA
jgi:hypothetical protein